MNYETPSKTDHRDAQTEKQEEKEEEEKGKDPTNKNEAVDIVCGGMKTDRVCYVQVHGSQICILNQRPRHISSTPSMIYTMLNVYSRSNPMEQLPIQFGAWMDTGKTGSRQMICIIQPSLLSRWAQMSNPSWMHVGFNVWVYRREISDSYPSFVKSFERVLDELDGIVNEWSMQTFCARLQWPSWFPGILQTNHQRWLWKHCRDGKLCMNQELCIRRNGCLGMELGICSVTSMNLDTVELLERWLAPSCRTCHVQIWNILSYECENCNSCICEDCMEDHLDVLCLLCSKRCCLYCCPPSELMCKFCS